MNSDQCIIEVTSELLKQKSQKSTFNNPPVDYQIIHWWQHMMC